MERGFDNGEDGADEERGSEKEKPTAAAARMPAVTRRSQVRPDSTTAQDARARAMAGGSDNPPPPAN